MFTHEEAADWATALNALGYYSETVGGADGTAGVVCEPARQTFRSQRNAQAWLAAQLTRELVKSQGRGSVFVRTATAR